MKTIVCTILAAAAVFAQAPDFKSAAGAAKAHFAQIKGNILKSAEKMPEENYSFKPTPDVRSYGQLIGHVADASGMFCAAAAGAKPPESGVEKSKTSKADLIAALKANFAFCDAAYAALTDANAGDVVKFFGGERSKLNVLQFNTMHDFEHYGNIVTYLRLKGIVPPSSEPRK